MGKIITILMMLFFFATLPATQGKLALEEIKPEAGDTHHFEVMPESLDGSRIPYMKITVTIIDKESNEKKDIVLMPMYGEKFHYGANVALKPGEYLLRFDLEPPEISRTDDGKNRWLDLVTAEFIFDASRQFDDSIDIGTKETGDMRIFFKAEHAESMFTSESWEMKHVESISYSIFLYLGVFIGYFVIMRLIYGKI